MERIKLHLTEQFPFSTTLTIRITDLNYGGHLGNDAFLSLLHEARQQYFIFHGYTELNIGGVGLIMTDAAIEYRKELNHGDVVKISVAATHFDKLGFDLHYLMEHITAEGNFIAAKAKTGMICYDYNLKKKISVPQEVIGKLTGLG